jgi:hypothetical protein
MPPPPDRACTRHAETEARARCETCGALYCGACTGRDLGRGLRGHFCPACDGRGRLTLLPPPGRVVDFAQSLRGVATYPLSGRGGYASFGAALLWSVVLGFIATGGVIAIGGALIVVFFATTYLTTFLFSVTAATTDGRDELPDWPDAGEVYLSFGRNLIALLVLLSLTFFPKVALDEFTGPVPAVAIYASQAELNLTFRDHLDGSAGAWATLGALALGQLYVPMGLLVLSLGGRIRDLAPWIIVPAILRTGPAYLVASATWLGLLVLQVASFVVGRHLPVFGSLVGHFVSLWLLTVAMRIIGLLYRTHGHRMGLGV